MTLITLSTVGFGELEPLSDNGNMKFAPTADLLLKENYDIFMIGPGKNDDVEEKL